MEVDKINEPTDHSIAYTQCTESPSVESYGAFYADDQAFHNDGKSGLLEVYYDNEWKSVCDDHWTDKDANVACRQLGFLGYGESLDN